MNIFVLDESPYVAARYHNDRHVSKMILETAQLLSTSHWLIDGEVAASKRIGEAVLRPTQIKHPCAVWARECSANYEWLHGLGLSLLLEYRGRYGKLHQYEDLYSSLDKLPLGILVSKERTPWPLCMPDQYKRGSAVQAYRAYYFGEKKHLASWKFPSQKPGWWVAMEVGKVRP